MPKSLRRLERILLGEILGAPCAFAVNGVTLLLSLFYGLNPLDPVAYLGVLLILVLVAMLATYLPARRATKGDPMIVLRYE